MKCWAPEILADYARDRLSERRAADVSAHLQGCRACRAALARVRGAIEGLELMRELDPPDVGTVRTEATIRWLRLPAERPVRPAFWVGLALSGLAAGMALWAARPRLAPEPVRVVASAPPAPAPSSDEDRELAAVVTLLGGRIELERGATTRPVELETELTARDRLRAQAGARLGAEWAEGSGLLLVGDAAGKGAELELERLRARVQRLVLGRGELHVRVLDRPSDTLEVATPAHQVSARGAAVSLRSTWFTVAAAGARTTVEVLEGSVEVTEVGGTASTLLHAPSRAVFEHGQATTRALSAREVAERRARAGLNLLPFRESLRLHTGGLKVSTAPEGQLAVDGVSYGATPLQLRHLPGRHYVEVERPGFLPIKRWVTLDEGEPGELRVQLTRESAEPPPSLEAVLLERKGAVRACYERSLKRDQQLAGTVSLRLRIGYDGRVREARVGESTLPEAVGSCLEQAAAGWTFSTGRGATVIYPFELKPE